MNDLYLISASVQSHADSASRQYSQGVAVLMQRVMSCHKLWDKLCQWWWGHWATCETLPLSPLWQQLTCTSQRQFRGCLSPVSGEEKKAETLVQGIFREPVNLFLKGPLHNLLLLGPLIDPPHATLCLLILAQFWIWPGCPGGVN